MSFKSTRSILIAGVSALAMVLAACGSSGTSTEGTGDQASSASPSSANSEDASGTEDAAESVEISFLTHWGPDQVSELEAAAESFRTTHPNVTVKFQAVPFANLLSTLQTQGSSSSGATIAGVYNLWLPSLIKDGIAAAAPDSVVQDVQANWPDALVAANSQDGKVYGIPSEVDLYALNYNKALFDAAGISSPPATWDELKDAAAKLTNTDEGVQGFGLITNWDSGVDHPFLSLAASNGATLLNEDGTAGQLTDPAMVETAQLYADLIAAGSTDPSMSAANANTTGPFLDNFANGKTAMIIMANWWESALKDSMGDNFADVATAPIPIGPSGDKASSISYSWLSMVNANATPEQQAAAWDFLAYLNGPDSGANGSSAMGDILNGMGILPSRSSDLTAHESDFSDPFIQTYVSEISDATSFPSVLGGQQVSAELQTNLESLIFGQSSPADAMAAANTAIDSALKSASN